MAKGWKEIGKVTIEPAVKETRAEKVARERKFSKAIRNQKRLTGFELGVYREACEVYAERINAFKAGKIVKGKGKNQTITVKPHPAMPSFKSIYDEVKKKSNSLVKAKRNTKAAVATA